MERISWMGYKIEIITVQNIFLFLYSWTKPIWKFYGDILTSSWIINIVFKISFVKVACIDLKVSDLFEIEPFEELKNIQVKRFNIGIENNSYRQLYQQNQAIKFTFLIKLYSQEMQFIIHAFYNVLYIIMSALVKHRHIWQRISFRWIIVRYPSSWSYHTIHNISCYMNLSISLATGLLLKF